MTNKSKEFRQQVAKQFVEGLKREGLNWKRGWDIASTAPKNGQSDKAYKGVNRLALAMVAIKNGYKDNRWLTFKQIKDNGYHLEKGSKGVKVEYWFPNDKKERKNITWKQYNEAIKKGRRPEDFTLLSRMYTVFNGDCIKGLPKMEEFKNLDVEPSEIIGRISENMGVPIYNDGADRAFYNPVEDVVHLPPQDKFLSTSEYNSTALHELAHATGPRLNRRQGNFFGSKDYAFEELIAEIASTYMGVHTGIDAADSIMENHQAYVNSWIESIEKDPEVLMKALKAADTAANYLEQHAGLLPEKELDKAIVDVKAKRLEFADKYYKFGVMLTSDGILKAVTASSLHDNKIDFATWINKEGEVMGNTAQLGIWLNDRPNFFSTIPASELKNMLNDIADFYGFDIDPLDKYTLPKFVDIKDVKELSGGNDLLSEIGLEDRLVKTNMGEIPIEDYRDIKAVQAGFDSYEDMYAAGYRLGDGYDIDKEPKKKAKSR